MPGGSKPDPGLMRSLGAFFGHIARAIREDAPASPTKPGEQGNESEAPRLEVRRDIQEARHGDYRLRRTTIDEVLFDPADPQADENARGDEDAR